jgi:hypothetical protein
MPTLEWSILKTIQCACCLHFVIFLEKRSCNKEKIILHDTHSQALNDIAYLTFRAYVLEVVEVFDIIAVTKLAKVQTSLTCRQTCPFPETSTDF